MLLSVDSMFIISVMNIKTHLQILQDQFRKIEFNGSNQDTTRLKALIKYHVQLLDMTESVNKIFDVVFFFQTTAITFQLSLVMFQILELAESLLTVLPNFCLLVTLIVELFMFCYGGELVTRESFNVNLAIQESCWYNLRPTDRVIISFMMARTQKPLVVTSGIFDASLSMFMKVWFFLNYMDFLYINFFSRLLIKHAPMSL